MGRKIIVFFLMLVTGTFMAWGETDIARRSGASEADSTSGQLPSVLRRSSVRQAGSVDRPAAVRTQPAAAVDPPAVLPPDATRRPAAPAAAPATGSNEPSNLPTVMRRKPRGQAPSAEAPSTPEVGGSDSGPAESAGPVEPGLPRPFGGPAARPTAPRERPANSAANLLLSGNAPGLRVEASGPRNIRRGRDGQYVVHVTNTGDASFDELEVRISLPNSVALSGSEASHGESRRVEESNEQSVIVWSLPRVEPRAREQLVLQLAPSQDRAFELGLDWVCRSPRQVATVEVQHPQLDLAMSGPKEARFGESLNYLVTVANPGSGDADNVVVKLFAGENAPETVTVGTVAAGQQKQIEVQMAANQAGVLKLAAHAVGDGDLKADAVSEIEVRRAELQADVVGPKTKFAGVPGQYQVRVANVGNAPADDLTVNVLLPPGARVESATEGARQTPNGLLWKITSLAANTERVLDVRCELNTTGENKVEARVSSGDGLAVAANLTTIVEALADLKLAVQEPKGPRQVGDELVYEIAVANRGTKASDEINVVVQFADGIEPVQVDGAPAEIVDGQVVFEPLAKLAAGQQLTLRVKARAEKTGSQRFRAEVKCLASDTQLVSEGTTRIFGGESTADSGTATPAGPRVGGRPAAATGGTRR